MSDKKEPETPRPRGLESALPFHLHTPTNEETLQAELNKSNEKTAFRRLLSRLEKLEDTISDIERKIWLLDRKYEINEIRSDTLADLLRDVVTKKKR